MKSRSISQHRSDLSLLPERLGDWFIVAVGLSLRIYPVVILWRFCFVHSSMYNNLPLC